MSGVAKKTAPKKKKTTKKIKKKPQQSAKGDNRGNSRDGDDLDYDQAAEGKDRRGDSADQYKSNGGASVSSDEDYSDDGDEGQEGYRQGGYHPVHIGDVFNHRYVVVEKLGWGHFSTVWMCVDKSAPIGSPTRFVALKVQKSATHYREAAFDEIELLTCAETAAKSEAYTLERATTYPGHKNIVVLLDHFEHAGPHGQHVCMVFEMLGENLLSVIKKYNYRGIPIEIVKRYVLQICQGLDFLHRHSSIIHTDLKPENILIALPPLTPPESLVQSLIHSGPLRAKVSEASSSSAHGKKSSNKKKKKKTKSGKGAAAGVGGASVERAGDADNKRQKKKMKKKRQKARKGGDDKASGGAKTTGDLSALEKAKEMMMMEKESEPMSSTIASIASHLSDIALMTAEELDYEGSRIDRVERKYTERSDGEDDESDADEKCRDESADEIGFAKISSRDQQSKEGNNDHKHSYSGSYHKADRKDGSDQDDQDGDYNDDEEEELEDGAEEGSQLQLRRGVTSPNDSQQSLQSSKDMLLASIDLSWLRPTLFSYLNFGNPTATLEIDAPRSSAVLHHLTKSDDSGYLEGPFSAKISMVDNYLSIS